MDKGGLSVALSNDVPKAHEFTLLDCFNTKLHAQSLDSLIQRIDNTYYNAQSLDSLIQRIDNTYCNV